MNLAKSWRNWKNRVRAKFFDANLSLEQNLRKRPDTDDERVFPDQWKDLVLYWSSDAAQVSLLSKKLNELNAYTSHYLYIVQCICILILIFFVYSEDKCSK